jgi:RES domain-containing protein
LVGRLDALGATALSAVAFRHVSVGTNPKAGTGARIHGGRWNPANSFATLYLGLEVGTVAAEFARAARKQGLSPEQFLPRNLCTIRVSLSALLDLRREESRAAIELSDDQLRADDPASCRDIAEAAHYLGLEGVLAPSATRAGTVLAVFLETLRPGSELEVIRTELWDQPPASESSLP